MTNGQSPARHTAPGNRPFEKPTCFPPNRMGNCTGGNSNPLLPVTAVAGFFCPPNPQPPIGRREGWGLLWGNTGNDTTATRPFSFFETKKNLNFFQKSFKIFKDLGNFLGV